MPRGPAAVVGRPAAPALEQLVAVPAVVAVLVAGYDVVPLVACEPPHVDGSVLGGQLDVSVELRESRQEGGRAWRPST